MNYLHLCMYLIFLLGASQVSIAQCPTTSCATHLTEISTATFPDCPSTTLDLSGNIDNNSDCEDSNNDNCWKYIFTQHDPLITGLFMDVGKGNGCNGEVNTFYTEIDGVCVNWGSSGSQNTFSFDFGVDGKITMWLCDNSSGEVSLCELCSELLAPAPVDLVSFSGKAMEFSNEINWSTASEEGSALFLVERSINGRSNFEPLGSLPAQGNSNYLKNYQMTDRSPFPITYYRLHSIDLDGSKEISDWVAIKRDKAVSDNQLHVFPLPLGDQPLQVYYQANLEEPIDIAITDISGRVLYTDYKVLPKGIHNWSIDLPQFETGLLVLKIISRSGQQTSLIPRIIE